MRCAICKKRLSHSRLRYITKIVSYAAYDPLEITFDDLRLDLGKALQDVLAGMKKKRTRALQEDIIKTFHYDLCPPCRKKYIKNPLGGSGR